MDAQRIAVDAIVALTDCDREAVVAFIRKFYLAGVRDPKRLTFKGLQALARNWPVLFDHLPFHGERLACALSARDRRVPRDEEFKRRVGAAADILAERPVGCPGRAAWCAREPAGHRRRWRSLTMRFTFAHSETALKSMECFSCWRTSSDLCPVDGAG